MEAVGTDRMPENRPGIASLKRASESASRERDHESGNSNMKDRQRHTRKQQAQPLLTGKALKDWIKDKGFNGVNTRSQRAVSKGGKSHEKALAGISNEKLTGLKNRKVTKAPRKVKEDEK